jgi:hypothetical protein
MNSNRFVVSAVVLASAAVSLRADDTGTGGIPPVEPSEQEQFAIWKLNQARHDPPKYGDEIHLDLTGVEPRQPLAVNLNLMGSTRFRAQEMLDYDYFAHVSAVTGKSPQDVARDAGYAGWASVGESIAREFLNYYDALAGLIVDDGVPDLGHRKHLLGISDWAAGHREIGAGMAEGLRPDGFVHRLYCMQTGVTGGNWFLTGVVFFDVNGNGKFDRGEGLPGVTVDAGGDYKTTSMQAGGWVIPVPDGIYNVRCSGGTFAGVATARVGMAGSNHEIDFASASSTGDIDFSGPHGIRVTATATPIGGNAPLAVDFRATSSSASTSYTWIFDNDDSAVGESVQHVFGPGVWVVRVVGVGVGGVGEGLVVVCANGPDGAGVGTSAPSSQNLKATAFSATWNRTLPGADSLTFTGTIEMPAGWTRGLSPASVVVAGVRRDFPLEPGSDSLREEGRGSFKLKYKRPRHGAPLKAGVKAKVTVTLKGDFGSILEDFGVRNVTEKRRLDGVPFVLTLGELCWGVTAPVVATTTQDASTKLALEK